MVFASAPQKSPMLMMRKVTVGMMDCLKCMITPFIYTALSVPDVMEK
jgi:hypothetical protein